MKTIRLNVNELIDAFQSCSFEQSFYLDTVKAEIVFISEYNDCKEQVEARREMKRRPDDFIAIPERDSRQDYKEMVNFTDSLSDNNLKEKLFIALDGKGAFSRFRNVLEHYPLVQKEWFEFQDKNARAEVKEWLEENEIELIG